MTRSGSSTPTQSITPTSTQSPSATVTSSNTASSSSTPSLTPSQTLTGFLTQPMIDNTARGTNSLSLSSRTLGSATWFGLSFQLPEDDPVCGPGSYRLDALTLALSLNGTLPGGVLPLTLLLYPANPATGAPLTTESFYHLFFASPGPVAASPGFVSAVLPAAWTISALSQRWYSLVVYTQGFVVNWHDPVDGVAAHVPARGMGVPAGLWTSVDSGATWAAAASYPGLLIAAQKTECSPSPSQSISATSSQSASQSQSKSQSMTQSASPSGTRTQTQSPTPSNSYTGPTLFDGTSTLGFGVLTGSWRVLNDTKLAAITFSMNESDTACGPGRWLLTQLWIPLSQVSTAIVDIRIQLFTINVGDVLNEVYFILTTTLP